ncbi:hypothetical protein B0H14DRAFT_2559266 [Mycena olivaceomarginata]|nr:hypothetical protein B0H14DRAFT_2559266 [Mycena olivaceomarginata]
MSLPTFSFTTTAEEGITVLADEIRGKSVLITGTSLNGIGFETARVVATYANLVIIRPQRGKVGILFFVLRLNLAEGQRDFAAAVILPRAVAAAAALQRQSAVVVLAAHVELLGITIIGGFKGVGALYCTESAVCSSMVAPKHMQTLGSGSRQHSAAAKLALCSGSRGIFSGTRLYAATFLQLSAAFTNGNTAAM